MWKLIQGDPDTVIRWFRPLLLGAMIGLFLTTRLEIPGLIACIFLGSLGAAGGSFAQYRTNRGLWILAIVFLLMYGLIYAMFTFGQIQDLLRNAARPPIGDAVDLTLGTALLVTNLRFLCRVAHANWRMSRHAAS